MSTMATTLYIPIIHQPRNYWIMQVVEMTAYVREQGGQIIAADAESGHYTLQVDDENAAFATKLKFNGVSKERVEELEAEQIRRYQEELAKRDAERERHMAEIEAKIAKNRRRERINSWILWTSLAVAAVCGGVALAGRVF